MKAARKAVSGASAAKPAAAAAKAAKVKVEVQRKSVAIALAQAAASLPVSAAQQPKGCRHTACELEPVTGDYCRAHYIQNWRKIKRKELILKEKKLNQYIEELVAKYPEKYIEAIRQDLAIDKDYFKVVQDLELTIAAVDEEGEAESIDSLLDNVRKDIEVSGGTGAPPVEDEDEAF